MNNANAFFLCYLVSHGHQFLIVRLVHVGKTRPGREVLPAQWMFREEINVVRNDHKVANFELRIHSACSITHEECLDAQLVHNPHRERHFFHVVALIEMETPLHGHDVLVAEFPENQFPGVSFHRGNGKMGYITIGELVFIRYF